jgi:hypothetical protein
VRRAIDNDMVKLVRKAAEIALGIDHHLLNEGRALLEQAAQQVRFPEPELPWTSRRVPSSSLHRDR